MRSAPAFFCGEGVILTGFFWLLGVCCDGPGEERLEGEGFVQKSTFRGEMIRVLLTLPFLGVACSCPVMRMVRGTDLVSQPSGADFQASLGKGDVMADIGGHRTM